VGYVLELDYANFFEEYDLYTEDALNPGAYLSSKTTKLRPQSEGELTFSIRGTAEVKSRVAINLSMNSNVTLTSDGKTYEPIKWTLSKWDDSASTYVTVSGCDGVDLATITTKLNATEDVDAGKTASIAGKYQLSYIWVFNNEAATEITGLNGNQADTVLGTMADLDNEASDSNANENEITATVEGVDYTATTELSINFSISVEQIAE